MYNPQRIKDLISKHGIKNKELLVYIGKNWNGSIDAIIKGDIRASKLEKIADFFGVPIDALFDRNCPDNRPFNLQQQSQNNESEIAVLKELIKEKDKRIESLNEIISLLKRQNQ